MDVINLVSSDEEGHDGGLKNRIKSNKNIIVKKVKTSKLPQNVNQKPMQKVTPPIMHPQNNNNNKQITVANQQPQFRLKCKIKSKDGKIPENKNTLKLSSGITITPVNKSQIISDSHKNPMVSNVGLITSITPKTNTINMKPKPVPSMVEVQTEMKPVNATISKLLKRIVPKKISDAVTIRASSIEKSSDSDMLSRDSSLAANDDAVVTHTVVSRTDKPNGEYEPIIKRTKIVGNEQESMHEDYVHLIEACKSADATEDMAKIVAKLEKYYHRAHTDFVNSKSFHKLVKNVTHEIEEQPKLVYMKINGLLEELRTRRAANGESSDVPIENPKLDEAEEKKAKNIQRLSEALRILQKRIRKSEEAEVDWDDEPNSKYLITERYKKRACDIYDKLCDLTGESRSAERIVKKPIKFTGTSYPEFNRKLEKFINEMKLFPDMFDVLKIMDHCSELHGYRLTKEQRKTVAQEAFHQVGTLLQKRRKADLYEMVQYFTANQNDPAVEDTTLKSKLEENQHLHNSRMKEVFDRFTMPQNDSRIDEDDSGNSPAKSEAKTIPNSKKVPKTSALLRESNLKPPELNLNADIDILNDGISFISDAGGFNDITKADSILIEEQDGIVQELQNEMLITSVTSLHPSEFNDLMNFSSNHLKSEEIL